MTRAAIKHGEEKLRRAVLASNVSELEALVSERVLSCRADGTVVSREDALAAYGSGAHKVTRYELSEMLIELHAETAVVSVRVELAGSLDGQPFEGPYRYTRTWAVEDGVWKVVGAQAGAIAQGSPISRG